ncbi:carbon-nitrogen hydrolase family protein [Nocardioides lijunqiniae]|uniref:carbon-nitrogen hydrolase family protein n=1 Tax=Nocardioides lijunqiniae TaxID=2760832 RepID=UPI001877A015|nr:carbon-nitrogen hydrolase family protein [Nocardioides lijunqiniae]
MPSTLPPTGPAPDTTVRVAAGQIGSVFADVPANLERTLEVMAEARADGVELLVLPECGLTGYVFDSLADMLPVALDREGPEVAAVAAAAESLGLVVVIGFVERVGGTVHNTAVLLGPGGLRADYRKTHLPFLGADRFVTPGDNEPVLVTTPYGVVGLSICYDLRFPEWARCLALGGADIIVNPTNWPEPAQRVAELYTRVRAAENHVFVIAANRGDEERNVPFIGRSQVIDPVGTVLATSEREEGLVVADIAPLTARDKDIVVPDADFAISLFSGRRPHLYEALTRLPDLTSDAERA